MSSNITLAFILALLVLTETSRAQSTIETFETITTSPSSTTSQVRPNYCADLFPQCSCLASPILIKCNNFSQFSELNFSKLQPSENAEGYRVYELELAPLSPIILDDTLDLSGLELYDRVILRNLNGFSIESNPFESVRFNNNLSLFLQESKIEFFDSMQNKLIENCKTSLLPSEFTPIFSSFNFISLSRSLDYTAQQCPLMFQNSNIRQLETTYLNSSNKLSFVELIRDDDRSINSSINQLRIYDSDLLLDENFLNKDVFNKLSILNLDYVRLISIGELTFRDIFNLREILFVLENMKAFIQSSNNEWMRFLNSNVTIDYDQVANLEEYYNRSLLLTFNNRNFNQQYSYPEEDLDNFQFFPHNNYVFARILTETNLNCSKTLEFLLKNWRYFPNLLTLNTTSVYKCLLTDPVTTTPAPRPNYCPQLAPQCSCFTSPILIKCNNFTQFSELNFSNLQPSENASGYRVYELELVPLSPIILDDTLDLSGLELYDRVILRNLNGFSIESNPFESARFNNKLNLFIHQSRIEYFSNNNNQDKLIDNCQSDLIGDDFIPMLASFNFVSLARDLDYSGGQCPLMFQNSNIRQLDVNYLNASNRFSFVELNGADRSLNSKIDQLRIYDSDLILDASFLNKHVFEKLNILNLDYVRLESIDELTFRDIFSLREILFVIENMQSFIQSSQNEWMRYLNSKVSVDYNQTNIIQNFNNKSLLLTFNNRNKDQNYSYPEEDLDNFQFFPHNNYVFARILTDTNLNCSKTLEFLLKNWPYFPNTLTLNTTSVYKCLLLNQQPTTPPVRPNYCVELAPQCSCFTSPILIKCNNFTQFSELNFTKLIPTSAANGYKVYELELAPLQSLVLDATLNLSGLELTDRVVLRNINGFNIEVNPFESVRFDNKLSLYLQESKIEHLTSNGSQLINNCRTNLIASNFVPVFSSFNFILFARNIDYTAKQCPLIFQNSFIRLIETSYLNLTNRFSFVSLIDDARSINSTIQQLRVYDADLNLDEAFLNKDVFEQLSILNLDYVRMYRIDDLTFQKLFKLREILFVIENIESFFRSSRNIWMKYLNTNVSIDYNQVENIQSYYNKSLLLTFNNRNRDQNYSYPNEDLIYFENFPHNNYVFARILSATSLECSKTLEFLLKNWRYFPNTLTLNTTSAFKCLLTDSSTTLSYESTATLTPSRQTTSASVSDAIKIDDEANKYSSETFLGTVIPLAILSGVSSVAAVYVLLKLKAVKKIMPDKEATELHNF